MALIKKDMKNKTSKTSSASTANDKRGQMLIKIDSLMEKINNEYGPFILDELQKRLEFTIQEFHDDLKIVLDNAFKKHDINLDKQEESSTNPEIPSFIAEHQKKHKTKN
jgi:hypothetical protein